MNTTPTTTAKAEALCARRNRQAAEYRRMQEKLHAMQEKLHATEAALWASLPEGVSLRLGSGDWEVTA